MAPNLHFDFQDLLVPFLFRWPIAWKKIRETRGLVWIILHSCKLISLVNSLLKQLKQFIYAKLVRSNTWLDERHINSSFQNTHIVKVIKLTVKHSILPYGPHAAPPPPHLGLEEDSRGLAQSLADWEKAIPNILETSLAEVSHAPPSATRMAPVT